MTKKACLVVAGPTAVGKTALAIALARRFDTAIISADSRQCYKELNIGVAKPSPEQLRQVKHFFINSHSIETAVNAALFAGYAMESAAEVFRTRDMVIMAGGTGLYIRAFCEGLDAIPVFDPLVRKEIEAGYEEKGLPWLQEQVREQDPVYYSKGEIQNPRRLMRALEVVRSTGKSICSFHQKTLKKRDFTILKAGIELPRPVLYDRINARVDEMMREGLLDEVRTLLPVQHYNALRTVGYSELFGYLEGRASLDAAVEEIKQNTRHYAKRQMTWFKKDPEIKWFSPDAPELIADWYFNEVKLL